MLRKVDYIFLIKNDNSLTSALRYIEFFFIPNSAKNLLASALE